MIKPKIYWIVIFAFVMLVSALGGCQKTKVQKITFTEDNATHSVEGIFLEKFDPSHIDIKIDNKRKMFFVPDELKQNITDLQPNQKVFVDYQMNQQSDLVIKNIGSEPLESKKLQNDKEIAQKQKNNAQENEIEINGGYKIKLLSGFTYSQDEVKNQDNQNYYVIISVMDKSSQNIEEQIQHLRWDASSRIKRHGELKELKSQEIPNGNFQDSKFVFVALNSEPKLTIAVKEIKGKLIEFVFSTPNGEDESNLWKMAESVK